MKAPVLFVLALGLVRCSLAQTNIGLGGSRDTIAFTGTEDPNDITLSWGPLCDPAYCVGEGSGRAYGDDGFFSLNGGGAITLTTLGGDAWSLTQTSPMLFCLSSAPDCSGNVFLEGDLQLAGLTQYGVVAIGNDAGTPDLDVTGGTLKQMFGSRAIVTVALAGVDSDLSSLLDSNNTVTSVYISSGSVSPDTPVPEPIPLALLGTALLLAALLLRRRLPAGRR